MYVLYGKKQEQVDELIKNKTKKKEISPDEYLSEGGQTIFGYLLVIIIVGAIVVKVFGIGEGSKHPGTYYNNPMHEGR